MPAPTVYFGSTKLPSRTCPHWLHVSVPTVVTILGFHPKYELLVGDAGCIFQRTGAADSHDHGLIFKAWPFKLPALNQIDLNRRRARKFDRRSADFPVALASVCVADEEASASAPNRQVGYAAWPHVGEVHVAAVCVGRQRVDGIDLGRTTQRTDVRLVGQRDALAPVHAFFVDIDLAHDFG